MLVKHETVIQQRKKTQICILNTLLWNKVLKSFKVIACSALDKITPRIHNQSGITLCTVCMGWHSHWEHKASPAGHRAKCLLWSGQQELQVLSKFGCNIILWLSVTVGLVRALKILPGSYKLSVHTEMTEIKRAFWRYLVQLPVQAESPRSRLLRTTHRWLLAISKMDIPLSLWAICSSAHSLSQ